MFMGWCGIQVSECLRSSSPGNGYPRFVSIFRSWEVRLLYRVLRPMIEWVKPRCTCSTQQGDCENIQDGEVGGQPRSVLNREKESNPTLDRDGHGLPMDIVSGNAQGKGPGDLDIH
jgi:hypothetical protein